MDSEMKEFDDIKNRIHTIRGKQVIIDRDLAELYGVKVKRLNEQVKRNKERFPKNFCFQLTKNERSDLVAKCDHLKNLKYSYQMTYAFTEQGIAMLSTVLKSDTAIKVSIQIMNAFVAMRKFIAKNSEVFMRLDKVERKQLEHDENFEKVFNLIQQKDIKPEKGIFFDGQVFDAHKFVIDLISSAKSSIVLIDNYIDTSVLTLMSHKRKGVWVKIYTSSVTEKLELSKEKFNKQYGKLELIEFRKAHDRFLIIDDAEVYHIGASLKDLGKKWFAFSRLQKEGLKVLDKF